MYKRIGDSGNYGEKLLYDFSLEEGDSIYMNIESYSWYYIDSIRYTNIHAGQRKTWFLRDEWGDTFPIWIEGIGSLAGILTHNRHPNLNWWQFPELLCAEYNNEIVYKSENGTTYGCNFELYDQTAPIVDSIWFEPDTIISSDTIYFYVKATDDISGVYWFNAWVFSESDTEKYLAQQLLHKEGDIYYAKIEDCMWNELGDWRCTYAIVYDEAANDRECPLWGNEPTFYVKKVVGVENIKVQDVNIYPNPTTGKFIINNYKYGIDKIIITDITGKIVFNNQYSINNKQLEVDISNQPKGLYFLQLLNNNKIIKTLKIIKL